MHHITSCSNCGQTLSVPSASSIQNARCPVCKGTLLPRAATVAPKRSTFEVVTWIVAILVLLPCGYFFFWLFSSTFKFRHQTTTSAVPGHFSEDESHVSSPPEAAANRQPSNAARGDKGQTPTALSEEQKGFVFMHTIGYGKGIEWAKAYRRVPTKAEYESIVAFATPDDPTNATDLKLQEAFLSGFKAGCKHALELQGPAF